MGTVTIDASKDGIKFSAQGDIGNGSVTLRQHSNVEKPAEAIEIELSEPVSLTFSLKYLVNFCKASALSNTVKICLSSEVPLLVEYPLAGSSYLRFYLAPKVGSVVARVGVGGIEADIFSRSAMMSRGRAGMIFRHENGYDGWLPTHYVYPLAVDVHLDREGR